VVGFTNDSQVVFQYKNPEQDFVQDIGINLKKYNAHQKKDPYMWRSEQELDFENRTQIERQDTETNEGVYTFAPQWDDAMPHLYGKLVQDISYSKGEIVEQITV